MINLDKQSNTLEFKGTADDLMSETLVIINYLMDDLDIMDKLLFVAQINKFTGEKIFNKEEKND